MTDQQTTFKSKVANFLQEFANNKIDMDSTWFGILNLITKDIIGEDEPAPDESMTSYYDIQAVRYRNAMRNKQRGTVNNDDDDALNLPIALYLSDFNNSLYKTDDDLITARPTVDSMADKIVEVTADYLIPRRDLYSDRAKYPIEARADLLLVEEMKKLGVKHANTDKETS